MSAWEELNRHHPKPLIVGGRPKMVVSKKASFEKQEENWVEGKLEKLYSFLFNQDGEVIEHIYYLDRLPYREVFIFDENSRITEWRFHGVADFLEKTLVFTYSPDGKKSSCFYYDGDGFLLEKLTYTYNNDGTLERTIKVHVDGSLKRDTHYVYTLSGETIEEAKDYRGDGTLKAMTRYTFPVKNGLNEQAHFYGDGSPNFRTTFLRDSEGQEIQRTRYRSDGTISWKTEVFYKGNVRVLAKHTHFSDDGVINFIRETSYTYEFDQKGNWIKSIVHTSKEKSGERTQKPEEILYRTITYWE